MKNSQDIHFIGNLFETPQYHACNMVLKYDTAQNKKYWHAVNK